MGFELIEGDYDLDRWKQKIKGHENDPEGEERCEICYQFRLRQTAKLASQNKFDYFTTTLSVSPKKDFYLIADIGNSLARAYNVKFLDEDFKKKDGFKRSLELSEELGLYRQDYCGCLSSFNHRKEIISEHEQEYQKFAEKLRGCTKCSDFLEPGVVYQGGANRPLMIIGQAPGKHERESLEPFSGPAGKRLWQWFSDIGYSEDRIRSNSHITAVAKCWPGVAEDGTNDAPPSKRQMENCLPWLKQESSHARPKLLLLVGAVAAKKILGGKKGMKYVGERIQKRIWDRKVTLLVLPHPSGLNAWPNMKQNKPKFEKGLKLLKKELTRLL